MFVAGLANVVSDHWILVTTSLLLCYTVGLVVYNLYFSPLAKFPGPFFARISSLPDFYWSLTGKRHLWIARNHEIHGDVVRFRPDGLLFKTPEAYRDIFNARANVKRSQFYDMMTRHKNDQSTLTGTDPALHARKRRVLNTVFSDKSLRSMEPLLESHVARWCELLVDDEGTDWSRPRKMSEVCDYLVLDVLCDLCFGRAVNTKEPGANEYRQIPHIIAFFLRILYPLGHCPWLNALVWLKPRGLDWVLSKLTPPNVRFLYNFVDESLAQRLELEAHGETRPDMLHYLLRAKDPATGLPGYTRAALEAEAIMLTIAGSDTTSVIMAGFFFYIVRTPHAYRKLVSEIRSTFASANEIRGGPALLSSCPYLRACVDEAMRITPAGSSELPRTVLAGGITIAGEFIPEGTTVGVAHWSFYRNPEHFPDPDVYRPERWIVDPAAGVDAEEVARARASCLPFSVGTTSCAGKNFALLELYLVIARTVWLFDLRLVEGDRTGVAQCTATSGNHEEVEGEGEQEREVFGLWDSYISIRDGPMVQFRRRRKV
ncbi:benzoate 4-monooxygenase cytochrome P450 [Aspergillus japonicus CBS 114.51]|uniref:Benzoate 4-monooxygenase cytochrome P450 n=2 Tax=Aspergillus TaxID=5052 RepID=A0A2V5HRW5_ASPV1|nr:benzoate 4-monooxygenase cytochrome P450 [Aspergillus japonicus CBS 114.51]PYI24353.1 benzoate 4-monooxygenase cytochrome P450 [Aspergillus violaceofuscus CBS 115571]RAH82840.1 benzoate 4-monooxygenase cytochrome P450 [Aspergillus japonicus CBS 114.51]